MRYLTRIIPVLLLLAALPAIAEQPSVTSKTRTVAAFKNGLGYFLQEGEVKLTEGWAVSDNLPSAALGTYWVGSPKSGVTVERLVALQEDVTRTVPAGSIQELLEVNVGKGVRLTVSDKLVQGKLIAAPSTLALIQTATGTTAINKASVSWVEIEGAAEANRSITEKAKRLRFKITGAKDKAPITIGYLQKGITWAPAYLVELLTDTKARITMQGLLANDVEDLDGVDVYFVVGYPNFMYSNIVSPLALTQSVTDFIQNLSRPQTTYAGVAAQSMSNFYAGDLMEARAPGGYGGFGYSSGTETPAAPEEDLFLYQIKDVSLNVGERAYYTVFTAEVPYEHVYEWTIPDFSRVQWNGYLDSSRRPPDQPAPEDQIWHKLRLTNTSKFPWTTAPGMATSNGQPLSQDTLNYTSKGAKGDLKITVATDIRGKHSETEKSRENDSLKTSWGTFAKVTSDGELVLKNFKSRAVTVTVKKRVTGEVVTASDDGKTEKVSEGIKAVNPTSVITWDIPLKAGEEKTINYTYFTYVRY
ncbi:MAG TPA: hypothetical protein VFI02_22155 [Armatimonadota bacterium]|nr:hypothetical protein [Armatimonadota bacterium]